MGQDYPPTHSHTRDPITHLTRWLAGLHCFIGCHTVFSFRVAITDWDYTIVSWLVTETAAEV